MNNQNPALGSLPDDYQEVLFRKVSEKKHSSDRPTYPWPMDVTHDTI